MTQNLSDAGTQARENLQRTLVLLKPDTVARGLVGRVLARFEERGLQICGLKMLTMSEELAARHYAPHVGKGFYPSLVEYMTSGPLVALVLEGVEAIEIVRGMMGPTNPAKAAPGTIRGDFAQRMDFNCIHGSDSPESAAQEIAIWFESAELHGARAAFTAWV